MVFYRKYRPQTLNDLLGQESIKQTLSKAFQTGRLSHAYLFVGPRGSGKTSTARILAKMVNCEKAKDLDPTKTPCNECSSCLSITDGSNLDLIEIDAASNRGIDDIRELRERIKLAPSQALKKVYIIDEVHMLTTEAFNALLKTLEEPPAHVLFMLATTEAHKIPQTILSRVQRLDFKLATSADLLAGLKKVVDGEKLKAEDEALKLIAKKADGSFRDALKFLDQLASEGEDLTVAKVEEVLNSGSFEDITALIKLLASKNTPASLEFVEKLTQKGISLKEFTVNLLENLRAILLIKNGVVAQVKEEVGEVQFETLSTLAQSFNLNELIKIINLVATSFEKLKYASIQSLPLEIALVEANLGEKPVAKQEFSSPKVVLAESQPQEEIIIPAVTPALPSSDLNAIKDKWNYILETIRPYNYSLEALLKQAKLVEVSEGIVCLEVPYSFHQRILEAPKSRNLLESVLSDVLGKQARVSTILGKRPVRIEELANVELAQDDEVVRIAAEIFNS